MKLIDAIIDGFWIAALLWALLYLLIYSGIPVPIVFKDILYAISGIMDYWLYINAILGTLRFVKRLKNDGKF